MTREGKFITTEPLGKDGEEGEKLVWAAVQQAFCSRECLGYWRYPIFSQVGKARQEPDILVADRDLGLIVIEVKAITIEQIVAISGHRWQYQNFYLSSGNPYAQAENQLFALLGYCDREPTLQRQISAKAIVALPYITTQQWQARGFHQLPSSPPLLLKEHLQSSTALQEAIQQANQIIIGKQLTCEQWELLLAVLAGTPLYRQSSHRVLTASHTKGSIINKLRSDIAQLDWQQEKIGKQIPPGPQRIRGIAGSGKTAILCQKAAHMHLKHPQWRIAVVFFSRSLYQPIVEQIDCWLRRFSNNEIGYNPKNRHLRVIHAWGGRKQPGLYSIVCHHAGVKHLTLNDTNSKQPNEALGEVCTHLLKTTTIPQLFDAILIDEGQDLVVDEARKFEDKQPFYWLAYQALRPVNPTQPEQKRLIWAYDEAQSLESLNIPAASELFGEKLAHFVTGKYGDGINKTEIMSRCYRTPHSILTAAHAMGMGWLRYGGMLTGVSHYQDWEAMGYQLVKKASHQRHITLHRPRENSPNPMSQLWEGDVIEFQAYHSRQQELTALASNILHNLRYDGLRPTQEILVIVLGSTFMAKKLETAVAEFLMQQGIDIYIPSTGNCNLLQAERNSYHPNQFWYQGAVTVSRIHRAKGHEADMVYVVGLDQVAKDESNLYLRNQLFVALTRARGWVNISGIGSYPLYEELHRVMQSGDTFTFNYRPPKREISVTDAGELLKRYGNGGKNFQHADLSNVRLVGADLRHANFLSVNFRGANLASAQLDGVKLVIANLSNANLVGASLRKAKLMGANLRGANLSDADFSRADLTNADLSDAKCEGTNFTDAIMPDDY